MIPFPDKKYKTIVADPPWPEVGGGKIKRGADRHYPVMKVKDIMALPVHEIADTNCHLYLWTTNNYLPDAFNVMAAWWLATADAHLLKSLSADANRTSLLGWMVACTWIFATLSWCYFFYTVVPVWYAWLPLGVFMGWIILCIDRMLMSGLQPSKKGAYKAFLLRVVLASLLGAFLAQPAMLFLFKKEIAVQQSIDQEQRVQNKINAYRSSISSIRNGWIEKEKSFKIELDSLEKASRNAAAAYLAEADGTGGSKQRGISNIALAKKAAWEKMEEKYQEAQLRLIPLIDEHMIQHQEHTLIRQSLPLLVPWHEDETFVDTDRDPANKTTRMKILQ